MDRTVYQETIRWKGTPIKVDAVRAENKTFIISGRFIKTAALKNDWQEDVEEPEQVIREIKASPAKIDFLKFWQRIPDKEPKSDYYHEWRDVAAVPITDYNHWWEKRISGKTRNMVRKSEKLGVHIEEVQLTNEFVRGIMAIFNQSPVRRGKRFWHYGKSFESVKQDLAADARDAIFVGAYYEKELIGFMKLLLADRYAMIVLILDKTIHRDKSPMNGMIAKAVQICAQRKLLFLTYTLWRKGDHGEFQKRNGFEKIPVPEYFVPLTLKGALALRLGLHKGVRGIIPDKAMAWLLAFRAKWYARRFSGRSSSQQ